MATFYLDPDNGNDASDGTTFANRKKTISAFTAAILAPGDTVRIIASPDPTNPANATWTDNSGTVTWAAAKNAVIDQCDSGWTAVTNITVTNTTTNQKEGSGCTFVTPASAFTTGKMVYKTFGSTLDLSAFQGVSFWFMGGALATAGQLELRLCSDTLGDTAVHTIALEAMTTGVWSVHTWDNGAALSNNINSVALYAAADPGTTTMRLDNIVACKASTSADYISHKHAIGKNTAGEPEWYSILSIDAAGIKIGGSNAVNIGSTGTVSPRNYRGTTETVATYAIIGIGNPGTTVAATTIQDSGTEASPILFSGGWDRTNMSTQSGVTYFQGRHFWGMAITPGVQGWGKVEKIGGLYYVTAVVTSTGCTDFEGDFEQAVGCAGGIFRGASNDSRSLKIKFKSIHGATAGSLSFGAVTSSGGSSRSRCVVKGSRIHGCVASSTTALALLAQGNYKYFIDKIDNNGGRGIDNAFVPIGDIAMIGTTFTNNAGTDVVLNSTAGDIRLTNCTYSTTDLTAALRNSRIFSTRKSAVATTHETLNRYYTIASETSVRNTASGISWKVSPTNTGECTQRAPATLPLAKIAVNGSALVTVKCWLRRTNTGLSASIRLVPSDIAGDPMTLSETLMTAAADTWEQVTLTFTPSAAGVVEIEGCAWGGTTYSGYFDDMTITQA